MQNPNAIQNPYTILMQSQNPTPIEEHMAREYRNPTKIAIQRVRARTSDQIEQKTGFYNSHNPGSIIPIPSKPRDKK